MCGLRSPWTQRLSASADIWLGRFDGSKYVPPRTHADADDDAGPGEDGAVRETAPAASDAKPPQKKPEIHENPLLSDAKAFLGLADDADAGWLKTTRDWLRGSADGKPPTRWQQLGKLDRVLRDELAASLNRRAEALGITLKEAG